MSRTHYAVGVDFGGTTIKTGLVTSSGEIVAQSTFPTNGEEGPKSVLSQMRKSIAEVLGDIKRNSIRGIGIGSPGIIDQARGIVMNPPNIRGWKKVPLASEIKKTFNLKVKVENDANVAAIAESKFGAGRRYPNFLFVIWGTGVGGGSILDGKIYRGPSGGAGEIGHVSIDYNGRQCNCGAQGCVEAYIGQRYLSQRAAAELKHHPDSKILKLVGGDISKVEPVFISRAALEGDQLARDLFTEAGMQLGVALASVLNTIDFRVVIIGGGISGAGDFVFDAIRTSLRSRVMIPMRKDIKVIPAKLGNAAGMLGAAGLVL
ncbi:MAG TPA: ROK family protein [Bacteroidota bacterium]|nr:ROK family protein [Bacteroidota bacterium]